MSETNAPVRGRDWHSTRQRVVVLTFDTPEDALQFDHRLHELYETCRDVIDIADEWWDYEDAWARMTHAVGRMRRALFDVRQATMSDG